MKILTMEGIITEADTTVAVITEENIMEANITAEVGNSRPNPAGTASAAETASKLRINKLTNFSQNVQN
jgi:hypothetical protein